MKKPFVLFRKSARPLPLILLALLFLLCFAGLYAMQNDTASAMTDASQNRPPQSLFGTLVRAMGE